MNVLSNYKDELWPFGVRNGPAYLHFWSKLCIGVKSALYNFGKRSQPYMLVSVQLYKRTRVPS
jgi:hypothetical protein